jgi:hypothetical protein
VSHGWASVRTNCMLGRYSSEIRTGCANELPSGSVRGALGRLVSLPRSSTAEPGVGKAWSTGRALSAPMPSALVFRRWHGSGRISSPIEWGIQACPVRAGEDVQGHSPHFRKASFVSSLGGRQLAGISIATALVRAFASATSRFTHSGAHGFAEAWSKSAWKPIRSRAGLISAFDINRLQGRPDR